MGKEIMQDSGVEWIGETPQHWRKDKIFRLAEFISSGGTPTSTNEDFYGGEIMWVQTGDLDNDFIFKSSKQITLKGLQNSSAKIFPKNTLLIAMYGATIGKLGILAAEATTNQACCAIFVSLKMDIKFTFYLFMAMKDYLVFQSYGGGQPNISQEIIKQQYVYYPPFSKQQAIAQYLDQRCGKLDAIIAIKQQQIKTLDALRQSIIYHAVTKGLDDSVPLVDSGVEWIEEVPQHWRKDKVFRLAEFISSGGTPRSSSEDFYGGDIMWVQTGDLDNDFIYKSSKQITLEGLQSSSAKIFPKNTLLIAMYGATIGKLGILAVEATTNQACCAVFVSAKMDIKFTFYLFMAMKDYLVFQSYGGGQPNISQEIIKQQYVYYPPFSEQQRIADHLDQETQRLNDLKANLSRQISALESYKKALIYECVTGKKRIKADDLKAG